MFHDDLYLQIAKIARLLSKTYIFHADVGNVFAYKRWHLFMAFNGHSSENTENYRAPPTRKCLAGVYVENKNKFYGKTARGSMF